MIIKDIRILVVLIIATIQDIKYREVSNLASLIILLIAITNLNYDKLYGFIVAPLILIITNIIKRNSFGGADIKIIASLGLYLGLYKAMIMLLIALIICMLINLAKKNKKQAFVPYILIAYIIIILY